MISVGTFIIGVVAYFFIGIWLSEKRCSGYYIAFWPFMVPVLLLLYLYDWLMSAPSDFMEKRKREKKMNSIKNKPSYILAGTIAALIQKDYRDIEVKRHSVGAWKDETHTVFQKDNILVRQTIIEDRGPGTRRTERTTGWTFYVGDKNYPFTKEEQEVIKIAFLKSMEWKKLYNENMVEAERQHLAISHIEEFMGIDEVPKFDIKEMMK